MKKLSIILLLVGVGIVAYLLSQKSQNPGESIKPTPQLASDGEFIEDPPNLDELKAGGSSYLDPQGIYNFLYPNDFILDTSDSQHIRIYKRGETPRPQSEISDGILMVFEVIPLSKTTFESWVDGRIKMDTSDGTNQVLEPKRSVVQNSYSGFYYSLRGFGVSQNLVLQKDKNSDNALLISYFIDDPHNKGYKRQFEEIISSLTLLK